MEQTLLFEEPPAGEDIAGMPLAGRMRPRSLDEFAGQEQLVGPGRPLRNMIERDAVVSMILWGPPGVGKTTLAGIIAESTRAEFVRYSAVTGGVKEVRDIMAAAEARRRNGGRTVLFVDEIHRFNRAQQDAFLPFVERGSIILIGATTENPSFGINSALLSRCRVFVLDPLGRECISGLLRRALTDPRAFPGLDVSASDDVIGMIAAYSDGDARTAYNVLEAAVADSAQSDGRVMIGKRTVAEVAGRKNPMYDRDGENHYDLISAFHKSMRNSDPDAAVYWLARMLAGGEDPLFIARRMIEFAGDDVGLADPDAQMMAVSCFDACRFMGMPDCRYALAETAVYLSLAPRSNSLAAAIDRALADAGRDMAEPVPMHLRNAPSELMRQVGYAAGYEYAEGTQEKVTRMRCLPEGKKDERYYVPGSLGAEQQYRRRLDAILDWKQGRRKEPPFRSEEHGRRRPGRDDACQTCRREYHGTVLRAYGHGRRRDQSGRGRGAEHAHPYEQHLRPDILPYGLDEPAGHCDRQSGCREELDGRRDGRVEAAHRTPPILYTMTRKTAKYSAAISPLRSRVRMRSAIPDPAIPPANVPTATAEATSAVTLPERRYTSAPENAVSPIM